MRKKMNPSRLPEPLRPFLPLFEKWGDARSDSSRHALLHRALDDPAEMKELLDWHAKLSKLDFSPCEKWMSGPLTGNYERAKVYFTFMLMYGELEIGKGDAAAS